MIKSKFTRSAGILMPVSSLPSPYGIGTFGKEAYEFVDFVDKTNHKYWQVLPLGPTTYGDSPYQSYSANAGNPYFIDLDKLIEEKLLLKSEVLARDWGDGIVPIKLSEEDALNNQEIATMIYTIGADYGDKFDLKKCNYKKVIIMTDADDDGAHIQILLLTFFFRYMRPLIEDGRVYLAVPPLFRVTNKGGKNNFTKYAYTTEELADIMKKLNKDTTLISRFKGLGEMSAEQLWDTTMNPKSRTLIKVTLEDFDEAEGEIDLFMGDDAARRRTWLENHVQFSLEDEYEIDKLDLSGDEE